ncbi:hypothetical protein FDW83_02265 [Pseudarthrobacter sp. NamE2]|nr:hypothetical protein [Pseudarthrobacter sp. NamE2]TLM86586.1 hypothetical protein FDW83_02265 [Pseudarthrobacter sp. NamE2]
MARGSLPATVVDVLKILCSEIYWEASFRALSAARRPEALAALKNYDFPASTASFGAAFSSKD